MTTYQPNDLNQYDRWDRPDGTLARQGFEYDADGNLTSTWLAGDMDGNGQTGFEDINPFVKAVSEGEAAFCLEYPTMCDNFMHADTSGNGSVGAEDINPFVDLTTYGNAGAARTYTWDAANRLSAVAPALDTSLLTADHRRVEFAYDYRNRMIAKQTYAWNPNATPAATWELSTHRKFVWSDWLLLLELDGLNSDAVVRKYTWGLDLAGLNGGGSSGASPAFLESAGGIGGLLATKNEPGGPATHAALTYDANGNVTQAFKWSTIDPNAALVAHYEYDPYGDRINTPDPSEYDQPFRFSTKMYDPTSELSYFGYRHYSPPLGRWIKQDPIGERTWSIEYVALRNAPTQWVDPDGKQSMAFPGVGTIHGPQDVLIPPDTPYPRLPQPPLPPRTTPKKDVVELWCYKVLGSPFYHCDVKCKPASGSTVIGGGTGFASSGGHKGPGGNPGWNDKPRIKQGAVLAGRTLAPPKTCECIKRKAAKLNAILGKKYQIPAPCQPTSNSNALLSTLLRCCNVSMKPTVTHWYVSGGLLKPVTLDLPAPGWGNSVLYKCGTKKVSSVCGPQCLPVTTEVPCYCPVTCDTLK